jgi:hypothetical protein
MENTSYASERRAQSMAKEKKRGSFHEFDPAIEDLAMERFLSGKQIYDYRTHRLKSYVRDDLQARAILVRAQNLAQEHNKELVLSHSEKKLLAKAFNDVPKTA